MGITKEKTKGAKENAKNLIHNKNNAINMRKSKKGEIYMAHISGNTVVA